MKVLYFGAEQFVANDNIKWKPIKDFEGLYEISSTGLVKSVRRKVITYNGGYFWTGGKLITPKINNMGYLLVSLSKKSIHYNRFIHRLVAEAFIPNPMEKPYVDHIDTNPINNSVENLRWCTPKENSNNPLSLAHLSAGLKGKTPPNKGKTKIDITKGDLSPLPEHWTGPKRKVLIQYSIDGSFVREWESLSYAAKAMNTTTSNISACCYGRQYSAVGFKWEYKIL